LTGADFCRRGILGTGRTVDWPVGIAGGTENRGTAVPSEAGVDGWAFQRARKRRRSASSCRWRSAAASVRANSAAESICVRARRRPAGVAVSVSPAVGLA
jgi:hypothetical protein